MKDDSPASTRSASPKLDWMIKRGMVRLGAKCVPPSNDASPPLSRPSVARSCRAVVILLFAVVWIALARVTFQWFCGSVLVLESNGLHVFHLVKTSSTHQEA